MVGIVNKNVYKCVCVGRCSEIQVLFTFRDTERQCSSMKDKVCYFLIIIKLRI